MTKPSFHDDAMSAFVSFLERMKAWEDRFFSLKMDLLMEGQGTEKVDAAAKEALASIFNDCLVAGKGDRRRLDAIQVGSPSTYDPTRDVLEQVNQDDSEVVFEYRQTAGLKMRLRFMVISTAAGWRILKAERFDLGDKKWMRTVI